MKKFWNFIVLALAGGAIGLQEFYMERWVLGVLAVLFCWTGIPALVAVIEAFVWLFKGEEKFDETHNAIYSALKNNIKDDKQPLTD